MTNWINFPTARCSKIVHSIQGKAAAFFGGSNRAVLVDRLGRIAARDFDRLGLITSCAIVAIISLIFVWEGKLFIGLMLNDFLLLTEIAFRVAHGEVSGVQFTNPIGIFAFAPQALVYNLTGDMVIAVLASHVFYAWIVLLFTLYISATRLNLIAGVAISVMLSILMLAPWVLGAPVGSPAAPLSTTAMFYNRFGFIVVTIAAMFAIVPRPDMAKLAAQCDAPVAAFIAVLAFYSKVPFGLAIICLVGFWHLIVLNRTDFLKMFALWILGFCILAEVLFPGLNWGYVKEQALAGNVAGAFHLRGLMRIVVYTLPESLPIALLPFTALALVGAITLREAVYFFCLLVGSCALVTVSAQGSALVTPVAVAVICLMRTLNDQKSFSPEVRRIAVAVAAFGIATSITLYLPKSLSSIIRHAKATANTTALEGLPKAYSRLRVPRTSDLEKLRASFDGKIDAASAYKVARSMRPLSTMHAPFPDEYLLTLVGLNKARQLCTTSGNKLAVTDFANAAASWLGEKPASGYAYMHYGRSFSHQSHPTAQRLFGDVTCLLDPKLPIEAEAREAIWDIYGSYFGKVFRQAGETTFWRVYVRKGVP